MEDIFGIIWRGLAVGLFVSAPMGPVGILCIQRTLAKGRKTGLYTGVGAAISDFIYCLLTGFGLTFIEDFLERNQNVIQLFGSAVLIGFAVYLFKKSPAASRRKHEVESGSASKDILGGFLFTFSNPLILFLIIGLFARFSFLGPGYKYYHYILGYASIVVGALGWWWFVTYFVDKLRAVFNTRTLKLINRGISIVLLVFALVGIITGVASQPMFGADIRPKAVELRLEPDSSGRASASLQNISTPDLIMIHPSVQASRHGWVFAFADSLGRGFEIALRSHQTTADADPVFNSFRSPVRHSLLVTSVPSGDTLAFTGQRAGLLPSGRHPKWLLTRSGDVWTLQCGAEGENPLISFPCPALCVSRVDISDPAAPEDIQRSVSVVTLRALPEAVMETHLLPAKKISPVSLEGKWAMHDYEFDTDLLESGGRYIVQSLPVEGGYRLDYLSGARINPGQWAPGRLKALLQTLPSGTAFDVVWIDPDGMPMANAGAALDPYTGALVIQFPNRNSKVRFVRVE